MDDLPEMINLPLHAFSGISLGEMDQHKLMNRIDSKFVFHLNDLQEILTEVMEHYSVLEIEGKRKFQYESLYFDTAGYDLYKHHHNGKTNRIKVRFRRYLDTGAVYFELKKKSKGIRTDKYRIQQPEITTNLDLTQFNFLQSHNVLQPELGSKMLIYYNRITLVSKESMERVTLDMQMYFDNFTEKKEFPNLVIAEVKQDKFSRISPFVSALRERNIREFKISKYSLSIALMTEGVKKNSFKQKINRIHKINNN